MELKEIILKPVVKAKFSGISGHSKTGTTFTGAQISKGGVYKTGLTEQEEKEYTEKLGLAPGTLAKTNGAFWGSMLNLRLSNDKPTYFYVNSPLDELKLKVILNRSDIAKSELDIIKNPNALFYIEDKEAKAKVEEVSINYLMEAQEIFMNMTSEERRGYLKLYNRKGAKDVSDTVIKTDLFRYINENPKKFLEFSKNPDVKLVIQIEEMLENELLTRKGSHYYYNGEAIGSTIESCVGFFKDVKNQSVKLQAKHDLMEKKKRPK